MSRLRAQSMGWSAYGAALSLLLVNDHWWKHVSLVPHWLTGKLSDFAGLIVATVSLALLVGARSSRARGACLAFVAVPFALVKLSPSCATALEFALTSLSWRVRPDPTDLVALLVAPLALRIAAGVQPAPGSSPRRPWAPQLMAAAGALACLASGPAGRLEGSSPYLVNLTKQRIVVEVSVTRDSIAEEACPLIWSLGDRILSQDDFVVKDYFYVEPHGALPLNKCLSRVAIHGLVRAIAADPEVPDRQVSPTVTVKELDDPSLLVFVEGQADKPTLRAGTGMRVMKLLPAGSPAPASDCPVPPTPQLAFSWIGPLASSLQPIVDKVDLGGGCFSLLLDPPTGGDARQCDADQDAGASDGADAGDDSVARERCRISTQVSVNLCMPEALLPFTIGDRIRVQPNGTSARLSGEHAYVVFEISGPSQALGTVNTSSCKGFMRGPDGVLLEPLHASINGVSLEVGQTVERGNVTYYLSRAQRSVISASSLIAWLEVHHAAN